MKIDFSNVEKINLCLRKKVIKNKNISPSESLKENSEE